MADDESNFKDWKARYKTAASQDPALKYPLTKLAGTLQDYTRQANGRYCWPSRELLAKRMTVDGEPPVALATITGWIHELSDLGYGMRVTAWVAGKERNCLELGDMEHVKRVERRIEKAKGRIKWELAQDRANKVREQLIETDTGFENVG